MQTQSKAAFHGHYLACITASASSPTMIQEARFATATLAWGMHAIAAAISRILPRIKVALDSWSKRVGFKYSDSGFPPTRSAKSFAHSIDRVGLKQ